MRPARFRPALPGLIRSLAITASTLALVAVAATSAGPGGPSAADGAGASGSSSLTLTAAAAKNDPNPVTPGDFTGYGFDQCLTPTQSAMDAWLANSPFLAAGIYISGDSRACRNQPNLTPAWVRTPLAKGWRLLPITLGPQASCQPRFPRYSDDFTISPDPGAGKYSKARTMGQNSATETVADAKALGLTPGSTLWYDLEGFNLGNTHCRESALAFVSAWSKKLSQLGFVPGMYSSASSGIKMVDDARRERPGKFTLPTRIWIADWNGAANTSTSFISDTGWNPGHRMKQYRGGHDETWGGVTINIDSNYLDLGRGSVAKAETNCGGVTVSFRDYQPLGPARNGVKAPAGQVKALQCLLQQRGVYAGKINGNYHSGVVRAVNAWQERMGFPHRDPRWFRRDWMSVLSYGQRPVQKIGSAGLYVRRVQRALNAADLGSSVKASGTYDRATENLVKTYQRKVGRPATGIVDAATWTKVFQGKR